MVTYYYRGFLLTSLKAEPVPRKYRSWWNITHHSTLITLPVQPTRGACVRLVDEFMAFQYKPVARLYRPAKPVVFLSDLVHPTSMSPSK